MTAGGRLVVRRRTGERLRPLLLAAVAGLTVVVATAGLLRAAEPSVALAVAVPVLAVVAVAAFVLPVHTLPAVALGILALVPTRLLPNDGPFNALPPLAILLGVWVFRRAVLGQATPVPDDVRPERTGPRFAIAGVAVLLAFWLALSTLITGAGDTSVGWSIAFVASALLPLVVRDARAEARLLRTVFLAVGALVGVYLLIEMVLGFSPLYGSTREFAFSVYRAKAAFAHPLFAGAFLTIPAALGIGLWLTAGRRLALAAGLLSAAGIVATVSRGSIAALGVAVAFALLLAPFFIGWTRISRWFGMLGIAALGGIAVLNFGPLVERADSIESQLSAGARDLAIDVALEAAAYSGWIGTGPGTSGVTGRLFDDVIIENSVLQLLISIGVPGLLLFLLLFAALAWQASARGNLGAVLALTAYLVAISGFNSLDAVRSMHILLGFLVLLAVHGDGGRSLVPPAPPPRPAWRSHTREAVPV